MEKFDVIVIGSGPGGYVCAIRAAQLGKKVAIIEKYSTLGGTCLNVGCIPSKALLDSSEHFYNASKHFNEHGIKLENISIDLNQMIKRKDEVVSQTCQGVKYLMDKNKIKVFEGFGSFIDNETVKISSDSQNTEIKGSKIVIATGSKPGSLPFIKIDKERVITSTEALNLKEIPKHLIVIGGGVIGLELGSVYSRLGSKVSVIEYMGAILPTMDSDISKEMQKVLKKQGMEFYLNHEVKAVNSKGKEVEIKAESKGEKIELKGDYCLVSVGRTPYTDKLELDKCGVEINERGQIKVNENLQTSNKNIYAIGDVVKGAMLAHKAEEEGVFIAELIAGQKPHINYNLIPGVVYTWPEASSVGKTEKELKDAGVNYKKGKFNMKALGRARASGDIDGFVKVLANKETDEVLGVHIVGARAADLIMEVTTAMEYRASAEDISRICHAHPTFSEAIKEAALDATDKRSLHM